MEFDFATIVSWVLGAVALFAGGATAWFKGKAGKAVKLGKESLEVIVACVDALEDDKLTLEEVEIIKAEALDVADAWTSLTEKA